MKNFLLVLPAAALIVAGMGGCASLKKLRPSPVREEIALLSRGWTYAEDSQIQVNMESGMRPLTFASPVLAGDKLIYGSSRFGLVALHKVTGKELWRKQISEGVSAAPLITADKVYAAADNAHVYALELGSGREIWKAALPFPGTGAPILAEGRLVVSSIDGSILAFDPATGKNLWAYKRPVVGGTSIKGGGNLTYSSGRIWAGMSDGTLLALQPQDGMVVLEKQFHDNLKFMDIDAKPIAWRDGLLIVTYDGKLRYIKRDGNVQWEYGSGGAHAPVLAGFEPDWLFLPSSDGGVYCISGNSGQEIWRFLLPRGIPTAVSVMGEGKRQRLVVTSSDQRLFVLDAHTGTELANANLGKASGSYAGLVADEKFGAFYVVSHYSRVYQFFLNRARE